MAKQDSRGKDGRRSNELCRAQENLENSGRAPIYGEAEDSLTFSESYGRRIDELLTLFLSLKGDKLVGFQVKGVRKNLRRPGDFGIAIKHGKIRCGLFFHLLAFLAEKPEQKENYLDLGQKTRDVDMELNAELVGA
jgi:hypothetical protein